MKCSKCGSRDIDFQEAGGQSICINCGTVLEESTIVSSIEFQETGDRSHVIGQYVAANCTKPFSGGSRMMGRHMDLRDARDTTLLNARRAITQVASALRLPPLYVDRAYRLYQLALQRSFIFGRRQAHVVATCLYIVCRQEKSPHLLIDFADALQVNVYILGKSFLQFTRVLNINLPVVDPSLYIHRYASQLELGDRMNTVVTTSLRIITRLKKDWIVVGRRPDGICAAALLIATRAYGIDVTQDEIAQIFRIANDTIRKRLVEFSNTPAAQLSLQQFHSQDITLEFDPPSFIRNIVEQYGDQVNIASDDAQPDDSGEKLISMAELESDAVYSSNDNSDQQLDAVLVLSDGTQLGVNIPKSEINRKVSAGVSNRQEERVELYEHIYQDVLQTSKTEIQKTALRNEAKEIEEDPATAGGWGKTKNKRLRDEKLTIRVISGESLHIKSVEDLPPDDDVPNCLFPEEERKKREAIWQKTFGPYMEERARRKREREQAAEGANTDKYTQSGKLRKKYMKQAQSTKPGASTSDVIMASKNLVKGASKKINYDALKGVFDDKGGLQKPSEAIPAPGGTLQPSIVPPVSKEEIEEEEDHDDLLYEDEGGDAEYDYEDDYY